jgi:hypothetical protein
MWPMADSIWRMAEAAQSETVSERAPRLAVRVGRGPAGLRRTKSELGRQTSPRVGLLCTLQACRG